MKLVSRLTWIPPWSRYILEGAFDLDYNNGVSAQVSSRDIQGTGATPAVIAISDGPTSNYGIRGVGSSNDYAFTLTNTGGAPATALAVAQARSWDCDLWVLGGPGDRELAILTVARIAAQAPVSARARIQNLAGETSLRELCAALKACAVVLTNDTGPMHVAAAVGTPVVVPFGSTSGRMTGPGLPGDAQHRFLEAGVPCSPCFRRECPIDFRCMTGITVEAVPELRAVGADAWCVIGAIADAVDPVAATRALVSRGAGGGP